MMKVALILGAAVILAVGLALGREFCSFVDDVCDIHVDDE